MARNNTRISDNFFAHVDQRGGEDSCWPYLRCKNKRGYGGCGLMGDAKRRIAMLTRYVLVKYRMVFVFYIHAIFHPAAIRIILESALIKIILETEKIEIEADNLMARVTHNQSLPQKT